MSHVSRSPFLRVAQPRVWLAVLDGASPLRCRVLLEMSFLIDEASLVTQTVKNLPAGDLGDLGSIPESGRSPEKGNGNPVQYSRLENPHGQRGLSGCSLLGHKELT